MKADIVTELLIPLPSSISHILTKGIFQPPDTAAVNDVRVISCFCQFGQRSACAFASIDVGGPYSFKDTTDWFSLKDAD